MVYLASPIGSTKSTEIWQESQEKMDRNEIICQELKKLGFDVYLPQSHQGRPGSVILAEQLNIIDSCDFLILVLSDTRGIYIEAGYAKARGKKIYALRVGETRQWSDWLVAFCDYIAQDLQDLTSFLKKEKFLLTK